VPSTIEQGKSKIQNTKKNPKPKKVKTYRSNDTTWRPKQRRKRASESKRKKENFGQQKGLASKKNWEKLPTK